MLLSRRLLALVPLLTAARTSAQSVVTSTTAPASSNSPASVALSSSASSASSVPSSSAAKTSSAPPTVHTITVGKADHKFVPDVLEANVGDIVTFQFFPVNHSVVRAEYQYPCIPYEKTGRNKVGFFSGFHPVDVILDNPPAWNFTVLDEFPVFFYCSAPGSCINYGMVGVINPNSSVSLEKQRQLAEQSSFMLQPGEDFPPEASSTLGALISATNAPAASTGAANSGTTNSHHGLSTGAVAGIAVGAALGGLLLAALAFFFWRTRKLSKKVKYGMMGANNNPPGTPGQQTFGEGHNSIPPPSGPVIDAGDMVYVPIKKNDFRNSTMSSQYGEVPPYDSHDPRASYARATSPGSPFGMPGRPEGYGDSLHPRASYAHTVQDTGLHEMPTTEVAEMQADNEIKPPAQT